ncbi:MAG: Asparagine synthase, glutamine-hydrolyzing [Acidimicrobiales bacterium]|nr:Asparagine synthase, glutamine-hydrolyzing [Acidimicrobiales bacterium]
MCGIAGVFEYASGRAADASVVGAMLASIVHRGPDDRGLHVDREVALGSRRLAIIDIAGGHQPMANEDGSVVAVCNGEIYNYRELAERLRRRGHRIATTSDTEVLVHLYEDLGDDLVHELRGMFAFALWDAKRRRLLVARDRVGIKPLYLVDTGARLVFGSEIKAVLQDPSVGRELNPDALVRLLALKYVPAPRTLFEGVQALPPGHLLTCDSRGPVQRRWWQLSYLPETGEGRSEEELVLRLADLLDDAVRSHLVSDVPFGALLSGGLDSSTVVALMARHLANPVKTFAVGYGGDDASLSELPYARLVAERYGTDHHELVMTASDLIEQLPRLVWHLDQPIVDEACLPNHLVAALAATHVKMVLTGEGGDELFAGYARYSGDRLSPFARRVPAALLSLMVAGADQLPRLRRAKLALRALAEPDEARRLLAWFPLAHDDVLGALVDPVLRQEVDLGGAEADIAAELARTDAREPLSRMLAVDTALWLPDDLLARGDKTSMAASLEARVPLLDHPLVEFAAGLPPSMKLRGRTRKYLLRKTVEPWLPPAVVHRPKRGFPTPVSSWLRGEASEFLHDHVNEATVRRRGLLHWPTVARLLTEHDRRHADHGPMLFGLLSLELWHEAYLDASARTEVVPG